VARFVLATNIISQILRRNAAALAHLQEAAENDDDLFMCPVVFYELWRGLQYRGADRLVSCLRVNFSPTCGSRTERDTSPVILISDGRDHG
jgi:predicted nucleic acid-binding protein